MSAKIIHKPLTAPTQLPELAPLPKIYIGIDPGASGGLAALLPFGEVKFSSMPDTERGIWNWIASYSPPGNNAVVVLEWITPGFFGIDKSSGAKLFGSYMALRMALIGNGFVEGRNLHVAKAVDWQAALGIPCRRRAKSKTKKSPAVNGESREEWKGRLKREAEKRFPRLLVTLATSDALLIATYAKSLKWCL